MAPDEIGDAKRKRKEVVVTTHCTPRPKKWHRLASQLSLLFPPHRLCYNRGAYEPTFFRRTTLPAITTGDQPMTMIMVMMMMAHKGHNSLNRDLSSLSQKTERRSPALSLSVCVCVYYSYLAISLHVNCRPALTS
jgi:hypothetical protein